MIPHRSWKIVANIKAIGNQESDRPQWALRVNVVIPHAALFGSEI